FGDSESFVFNKLEEIVNSEKPRMPTLGCGVTYALSKEYPRTNSDRIICLQETTLVRPILGCGLPPHA
ncbi:hypothetical protein F5887DRAFT_1003466, partial [Amanita rubescens]